MLGLSGGLDSSVTVTLLADALGPENVLGVSMPSKLTPETSRSDAAILTKNLGIHFVETKIGMHLIHRSPGPVCYKMVRRLEWMGCLTRFGKMVGNKS